jgi:ATP-dependent Clp protease ATP-binding subunit ClpC
VFERFTPNARSVVVHALDDAADEIGTRELVLGLLRERDGIAARVLRARGLEEQPARERPHGARQVPFTQAAKQALEAATEEADDLGHGFVGTEHVLLGVLRHLEPEARELVGDPAEVRAAVLAALRGGQ